MAQLEIRALPLFHQSRIAAARDRRVALAKQDTRDFVARNLRRRRVALVRQIDTDRVLRENR